jgi:hypothetical protein
MGTYTQVASLTQGDRPVFKRVGSTVPYLFYSLGASSWLIGNDYMVDSTRIVQSVRTAVLCPDQAPGWRVIASGVSGTFPIRIVRPGAPQPLASMVITARRALYGPLQIHPALARCMHARVQVVPLPGVVAAG